MLFREASVDLQEGVRPAALKESPAQLGAERGFLRAVCET
jgi:hypothetical protein